MPESVSISSSVLVELGSLKSMKQSTEKIWEEISDTGSDTAKNSSTFSGQEKSKEAVRRINYIWFMRIFR